MIVGLILTQGLHSINLNQPAFRFAHKLEGAPEAEFYDILKVRESFYLAGSGLIRLENGTIEEVFPSGRYTALCLEEGENRVWYAGPKGIGALTPNAGTSNPIKIDAGSIWELILVGEKLWYFGSLGFGWIDTDGQKAGDFWSVEFTPRPIVFNTTHEHTQKLFVSDDSGLHRISENGFSLVIQESLVDGNLISWMVEIEEGFLFGTVDDAFSWSGKLTDEPIRIDSNYQDYFKKGLNNAISFGDEIAITEYPYGIALWNPLIKQIDGYVGRESGLEIGDVFKSRSAGEASLLILGTEGVGEVDLSRPHRFYPAQDLWGDETYRGVITQGKDGFIFSDKHWIRISEDRVNKSSLKGNPYWIALDRSGNIAVGDINSYEVLKGDDWEQTMISKPLFDLVWGETIGYAVGQDGLYSVSDDLGLGLIYPAEGRVHILGEIDGIVYLRSPGGKIISLEYTGSRWLEKDQPGMLEKEPLHAVVDGERIILSTRGSLFALDENGIKELPIDAGWEVRGLASNGGRVYAALFNRGTMESAIGQYRAGGSRMMVVPYLEQVGELQDILCTAERLGLVGDYGLGWYGLESLQSVGEPEVSFDLLFQDKHVENRTIPSGMHFIDLQINYSHPEVPSRVQYRINEQRWRNVSPEDPSLQFTGHGNFTVELRAIHPNGVTTETKVVQFGIAPPWYLNPLYQVILLVIAMLLVWGIYILRHRQLKKTNLWLESEVRKQTRELQTATEARTNFLAGLSHDIRNPLNGVLMIAETLSRNPPKSGDDRRLRDLTEFGIIVDRMLGEILDFSAIDQSNVPTTFIPVSIADILRSSITQNQFSIQQEMINLSLSLPKELEGIIIKTDRNWMIKVLANLIINAIEYSGTEKIEVGARNYFLSEKEIDLEIFVKDWGCGIDDSEKQLIFDRFYRGESGIESGKHGTGLGLSICQDIAHAMGAHLLIEDNEPSGSTFILRGRFERVEGAVELDKDAVLDSLRGKNVLVVDDLDYNRHSIVDFFTTIGCHCDQCGNGREALDMLGRKSYDLALLDWDLPGMMGPDIARAHRKSHPEDKVILIALTAYTEAEKKNLSEKSGMNGYISKPLTASRLAYSLANVAEERPEKSMGTDRIDQDELLTEVQNHIEECIRHGENSEWENLRRCAHRMTTLALSLENKAMQQVCRDLQIAAQSENLDDIHIGLAEIRQWRK